MVNMQHATSTAATATVAGNIGIEFEYN